MGLSAVGFRRVRPAIELVCVLLTGWAVIFICVCVGSYPCQLWVEIFNNLSEGCYLGCLRAKPRLPCPQIAELRFSMEKLEKLLLELFLQWKNTGHQKRMMILFQLARKLNVRGDEGAGSISLLLPLQLFVTVEVNLCWVDIFTKLEPAV